MHPSRSEPTSGQLTLEIGRWSASLWSIAATAVSVVLILMLAKSTLSNNARADDWQQRAVAAEEIVGGLRVVIADRSAALNERTRQANALASTLDSNRGALRDSKSSLGSLSRRQNQLMADKIRAEKELQKLQSQHGTLYTAAQELDACSSGLQALVGKKAKPAARQARLDQCRLARASFQAFLKDAG
jgi:hypothetical protein